MCMKFASAVPMSSYEQSIATANAILYIKGSTL